MLRKSLPYVFGAIFILIVVWLSWCRYNDSFFENILVELHGLIFDTFVIGLVVIIYTKRQGKKSEIINLKKEVILYKSLKTPEFALRIIQNYQTLYDLNEKCDLSKSWLGGITIDEKRFSNFDMANCTFSISKVTSCDFRYTNLKYTNGNNSNFYYCDFRGTNFYKSEFNECNFIECSFNSTLLQDITFKNVLFEEVNFVNAHLMGVIFESCEFKNVHFDNTVLTDTNLSEELLTDKLIINNNRKYIHQPTVDLISNMNNNLKFKSKIASPFNEILRNPKKKYI